MVKRKRRARGQGVSRKPGWGVGPQMRLDLRAELKVSAARAGLSMEEHLHNLVASALGLESLRIAAPEAVGAA